MADFLTSLVSGMPHWLAAVLLSMLPVAELRLAIPVAITQYGMNSVEALLLCSAGNIIPAPFIILFSRPIFNWMKNFRIFKRLIEKIEARGYSKSEKVLKYKFWGLFILVAIPLPGTGAWTGALVAALMDLRLKSSMPAISLGVFAAGIIVTLMTTGVLRFLGI